MPNNPLVSIIIPNFNTEKYLSETIESVMAQTYTNWELLIVDDHSTDRSLEIIDSYLFKSDKIKLLKTPINSGGPATPRNIGLDNTKGDYIAFLDSDDTWFPKKLQFHINFMIRENSRFSSTLRNTFYTQDEQKHELIDSMSLSVYDYRTLLKKNLINTSAVIITKELIDKTRFDTSKPLIAIEDYDFWLTILKQHKERILIPNVETINYRITGENISRSKLKMAKKFLFVITRHETSPFLILYYFFNYSFLSLLYKVLKR